MSFDISSQQSVFNHVVSSIIAQGRPSVGMLERNGRTEASCMYRGKDGAKCAAGWCIPDDKYTPEIEGLAAYTYQVRYLIGAPEGQTYKDSVQHVINQLQGAHDNAASGNGIVDAENLARVTREQFLEDFRLRARRVAKNFNLDASICGA